MIKNSVEEVFYIDSSIRFDDQLTYASDMAMITTLCPANQGLPSQHAMRQRWNSPLKVIGPVKRQTDFEWTVYHDILIEQDVVTKLKRAGFSGVEYRQVEMFTTTQTPIGREVFELRITGWGGMASPTSGIRVIEICPKCNRRVYSGQTNPSDILSPEEWDGSDFFMIWPLPRTTFVTKRVAEIIASSDFSDVCVNKLESLPNSINGKYSPGHIQDWFDGDKLANVLKRFGDYL
jgi:hypothetical protein